MRLQRDFHFIYALILAANLGLIAFNILIYCGLGGPIEVLSSQLNLRKEGNVAVWWSSAQLLIVGTIAALIAVYVPPRSGKTLWHRVGWGGTALLMIGLSADEVAQLHEWAGGRFATYFSSDVHITESVSIHGVYLWLVALSPLIIAGAIWLIVFVRTCLRFESKTRYLAFVGIGCWLITILMEFVEAIFLPHEVNANRGWQAALEEGGEVFGAACFLIVFLEYVRWNSPVFSSDYNLDSEGRPLQ